MTVEFDPFAGPVFEKSAPTTESQREVFAAAQWGAEANCAYNESGSLRFTGILDVQALSRAFAKLADRHEALRMFFARDGQTMFVRPPGNLSPGMTLIDLTELPEAERNARLAAVLVRDVESPFDLENGPLFKATLLKTASNDHQLVMTGHHIVVDGWSWGVLLRDLGVLYTAESGAAVCSLTPAPSFVNYATNERVEESGESYAQAQRYWLNQFSGLSLPELDLPTDRRRPAFKTYASRRIDFPLPKELTDKLKKTGAKLGASYFVSLLAGFAAMLHRLTRQDDLVVGTPVAGQAAAGEQNLVGHGVNMLPLRVNIREGMTFAELITTAQTVMLDGAEHQQMSYGAILKQLAIKRDPSRLPLINVVFNLDQAAQGNELGFAGVDVRFLTNPRHFENFELFINASETLGETILEVQYNTDLFDAETVTRWLVSIQTLLESAVSAPHARVDQLNILAPAEHEKILKVWNATAKDYPRDVTLHEIFESQVDRTPDAVAVEFEGSTLSYRELDVRANQLAHHLRELGVGPDVRVGVFAERSLELVIALYGVLKAGGAYVPLDPGYPLDRLTFMVEDADVSVLLTQSHLLHQLPQHGALVLCLDGDWAKIATQAKGRLGRTSGPRDLAYVIFTSGSTGRPKGAMNEHTAVVNRLVWMQAAYKLEVTDVVLQKTPFSFDVSVWEFFWPLQIGARMLVARPEGHRDTAYLLDVIKSAGVTTLHFVPSMLAVFLEADGVETCRSLKRVVTSGEALAPAHVDRFFERLPHVPLHNLYGPTEAAIDVTHWTAKPGLPIVPIGQPIANIQIYIVDSQGQHCPVGVGGELWIGGVGVGRGYLNRPDLTAEKFIDNPFADGRLYRTGDLARWQADGQIEYLGRIDQQVKVRGFRIELGEIEAVLASFAGVCEAAVMAREDAPGDKRLVAYLVTRDEENFSETGLRKHLRKKLPDYMIPQHFVTVDRLPLSPNGKLDRKALPAPIGAISNTRRLVAPRTDPERLLAELFQAALKVSGVSVDDNFFDLGGHSLLCFQVIAQVQERTGVRLNPRVMMMNTLEQTAMLIEQEHGSSTNHPSAQIDLSDKHSPAKAAGFAKKMLQRLGL